MRYLLLIVLGAAAALALARSFHLGTAATGVALVLGLAPSYLAWAGFDADRTEAAAVDLDTLAGQLALAVRTQWDGEAAVRRVNDPYPLPVAWRAADEDLAEPWPLLTDLARAWPGGPPGDPALWPPDAAGLAGADAEIGELFADRVPTRRLVVLGEPGAGKSVLLIRLLQDLLERRTGDSPVPVLFSLASWDPARALTPWLAEQLRRTYPGLRATVSPRVAAGAGAPADLARALLDAGRILPLLDGLDELPKERHAAALDALNRALPAKQPVVLASRAAPYRAALTRPGTTVRLNGAAAIQLLPLTAAAAADYLRRDAGGPYAPAAGRWDAVVDRLGRATPVGDALSTPLGLFLARTIYNPRPHAAPDREAPHPDELCDTGAFPDRATVDAHLFQVFIPAAYTSDGPHPPRWSAEEAHRTFVFLARFLQNQRRGSPDLAWWELPQALPARTRYLTAGLAGLLASGLAFGIAGSLARGISVGIAVGMAAGVLFGISFGHRVGSVNPRARLRWSRIGIAIGIAIGISFGMAGALAGGIAGGLAGGHRVVTTTANTPLRWSPGGIAGGIVGGVVGGYAGSVAGVLAVGIAVGLAVGIAFGISFGHRVVSATPSTRLRWSPGGITGGVAAGIAGGVAIGIAGGIAGGVTGGVGFGTAGGVAGGIAFGLETEEPDLTSITGPATQFSLDRRAFIEFALAFGLAVGIAGGIAVGIAGGLAVGIAGGAAFGFAGGLAGGLSQTAWAYFVVARAYLSMRHEVPRDLMAFLQDAHAHRGVLRQVGAVYQFRHIDLQRHLAQ